jgi:hypothetical protein
MGIDATVYCDCFEQKRIRVPAQFKNVALQAEGYIALENGNQEQWKEFDKWRKTACPHVDGILKQIRIGNSDLIGFLEGYVQKHFPDSPLLLSRVISSGTHTGDFIPPDHLEDLKQELNRLDAGQLQSKQERYHVIEFKESMGSIIQAALSTKKPIVF